jgi:type I restriction enzyme S subunit
MGILGKFLLRGLQNPHVSYQFSIEANGVTRYGLSHGAIKNISILVPPLPEQEAIVKYMDYMDRRIRRYINNKKKLIVLLNEQKQAIIHQAVIRGLDPNVRLKPSGVEWLGDIPEHWEVARCSRIFIEVSDNRHPDERLLSIDRFKGIIPQEETGRKNRASQDRSSYKLVKPGQLAYNLMNAFMGAIGFSGYYGIVSPAYAVAKPIIKIDTRYFYHLLRTPIYTGEYTRLSYGIMYERNRLYFNRFKLVSVLLPPLNEQKKSLIGLTYTQKSKCSDC